MRQSYNAHYHPPIPALEIRLYSSITDRFGEPLLAILDTGSDASLMPLEMLIRIGAEETAPGWLIGITGNRQPVSLFFVDVYIGNVAFPGIRVIGDEKSQDAILGRDILNKLPLFLDGIQQQTMVLDDTVVQRLRSR